jgi:hypothetical protein
MAADRGRRVRDRITRRRYAMNPGTVFRIATLSVALVGLLPASAAATTLLYDVDFGTPPHTVGAPPVTGGGPAPRETISEITFGDPLVVFALGALTDQPCAFGNGTSGYDQIKFITSGTAPGGFGVSYDTYHVAMQVLVGNLSGGASNTFRFFVDMPSAHSVKFQGDGNITVYPGNDVIGTYTLNVPVLLEIDVDVVNDEWTVSLDGTSVYTAATVVDELRTVRVNLDGFYTTDSGGIDNVKIYGDWPPVTMTQLYDVDFGTPPHTVGLPPVTGTGPAPRATPTSINFGDPTVVAGSGGLAEQPCQFGNGTTGYDQLQFAVSSLHSQGFPVDFPTYRVDVDMMARRLAGPVAWDDFSLLLDLPSVHRIDFKIDNTIQASPGGLIGTWMMNVPVHVSVLLDIPTQTWAIALDGAQVYTGPVTAADLRTIRVHLTGNDVSDYAAADNFGVWGIGEVSAVREPIAGALTGPRLLAPYPNPARDGVWFRWEAGAGGPLRVEIFDVTGREVWSRAAEASCGALRWPGVVTGGRRAEAGTYFVRLRAGDRVLGREAVIVRR